MSLRPRWRLLSCRLLSCVLCAALVLAPASAAAAEDAGKSDEKGWSLLESNPDERITREQMAAVFCWYAKYKGIDTQNREDLKKFTDAASVSGWALDSVSWRAANSILSGTSDGRSQPGNTATRAEAAQILMNFCENVSENNPSV